MVLFLFLLLLHPSLRLSLWFSLFLSLSISSSVFLPHLIWRNFHSRRRRKVVFVGFGVVLFCSCSWFVVVVALLKFGGDKQWELDTINKGTMLRVEVQHGDTTNVPPQRDHTQRKAFLLNTVYLFSHTVEFLYHLSSFVHKSTTS